MKWKPGNPRKEKRSETAIIQPFLQSTLADSERQLSDRSVTTCMSHLKAISVITAFNIFSAINPPPPHYPAGLSPPRHTHPCSIWHLNFAVQLREEDLHTDGPYNWSNRVGYSLYRTQRSIIKATCSLFCCQMLWRTSRVIETSVTPKITQYQ